jgi:hypothetical protein
VAAVGLSRGRVKAHALAGGSGSVVRSGLKSRKFQGIRDGRTLWVFLPSTPLLGATETTVLNAVSTACTDRKNWQAPRRPGPFLAQKLPRSGLVQSVLCDPMRPQSRIFCLTDVGSTGP